MKLLHAEERHLKTVFSSAYEFRIPTYQRPYSWGLEQAEELLTDLEEACSECDSDGDVSPYFLGTVVVIKADGEPKAEVVDGQQRLATLTILFSVLRDLAPFTEHADHNSFVFQKGSELLGTADHYRLTLRQRDQAFFEAYVQEAGATQIEWEDRDEILSDSQKRIIRIRDHFAEGLSERSDAERKRLMQFIAQHCYLVIVAANDQSAAFRIFSVINDRGLDLSPADILKSEVLQRISEAAQSDYARKWEEIEAALGRKAFEGLFPHIQTIINPEAKKYRMEDLIQHLDAHQAADSFIKDTVVPFGQVLEAIKQANFVKLREINTQFSHLNRLPHDDWVAPVLRWLMQPDVPKELTIDFIQRLDRFVIGLELAKLTPAPRRERMAAVVRAIQDGYATHPVNSPMQLTSEEKRRALANLKGDFYTEFKTGSVARAILLRLDEALSSGSAHYDTETITIEHVMPQEPQTGSDWLRSFPNRKERDQLVHCLGNLVLLPRRQNSRARNYEFEKKKNEYFSKDGTCVFALTSQVLNQRDWTPGVIAARQQLLIDHASRIWDLGGAPEAPKKKAATVKTAEAKPRAPRRQSEPQIGMFSNHGHKHP